ncbi:MAG: FliM/FliN family flagellar motor switch protein [Planctomycetota bacterium]
MKSPLLPEELEAVLATVAHKSAPQPGSVAPRDFARPQRLSGDERTELRERLVRVLPALERELSNVLRSRARVSLSDVDEIDAGAAIAELRPPMAVAPFLVAGQPCWFVWESVAAVSALELALGAPDAKSGEPRKLTSVEGMLFKRVASSVLRELGLVLDFNAEGLRVATLLEELGSPRDGGAQFDPRRLLLLLELEVPTGTSALRLYLPPPRSDTKPASGPRAPAMKLPEHLQLVPVSISARLGAADLALSDLLALEVGDVIPLGVSSSAPLEIWAEDLPWAQAMLGASAGRLALRLHSGRRTDDQA